VFWLLRCLLAGRELLSLDAEREVERGFARARGMPTEAVRESASSSDELAILDNKTVLGKDFLVKMAWSRRINSRIWILIKFHGDR
jgi:hypothetical protein